MPNAKVSSVRVFDDLLFFVFRLGVYFESCHKNIKFVDFCGKFYLPLLQFLCSPACTSTPTFQMSSSESEDTDETPTKDMTSKFKKVLLGWSHLTARSFSNVYLICCNENFSCFQFSLSLSFFYKCPSLKKTWKNSSISSSCSFIYPPCNVETNKILSFAFNA